MSRVAMILLTGAFCLTAPPLAAAEPYTRVGAVEGVTEYRLPNGLRVLLLRDDSKPLVTVSCTVLVGNRHEGYGETGMAHLLEHMLFKGTPACPDVPKALRAHGARFNAYTSADQTIYFETMPATDENLAFGIRLEADRLVNSFVRREDLVSEFTVVRNELEDRENNPGVILGQRMMATAYEWHNYGKSVIGNRADIERVPIESLQAFYKRYYRPDNALLVVAGKFDEKKALDLVAEHFGPLKKPDEPLPKTYTEEPPQDGERVVTLRRVGSTGGVGVLYHIPAGAHPDFAAVEVLAECLAGKPAGRLYKALVESKKATGVEGVAGGRHDPGAIILAADVADPAGIDAARDALIAAVEGLAANPITEEEVDRVRERFRRGAERLAAASDQLALALGSWAGVGDWRLLFLHRDRLEKVTAADVNRVAAAYLTRNNRTVGVYHPSQKPERVHVPPTPEIAKMLDGYRGRAAVAAGESFEPTPEAIEARVVRGKLGAIQTAFLAKKTRGETVELRLNLRYGNEESLAGPLTAAGLLSDMLPRGTKKHTRQQLTDAFDKLGARVSFSGGAGVLTVSVQAKRDQLATTLRLVAEVLREPTFPEDELAILKAATVQELEDEKTDPAELAQRALKRKLQGYPKEDIRYTPTPEEAIERVKAVTREQLVAAYAQLGAQVGELGVVGDFDPQVVTAELGPALTGWTSAVPFRRIEKPARPGAAGEPIVIDTPDKANAVLIAGLCHPLTDADPEYPAMQVANFLLGGGMLSNRLAARVRGEAGLSYDIGSVFEADALDRSALFAVYGITNPANVGKVESLVVEEVRKFLADGPGAEELEAGKKAYLDLLRSARADDGRLAGQLAERLYLGRTFRHAAEFERKVEALTPAGVRQAFGTVVDPKRLVVIKAGDFKTK